MKKFGVSMFLTVFLFSLSFLHAAVHQIKFFEYHTTYDANGPLPGGERHIDIDIPVFNDQASRHYLGVPLFATIIDMDVKKTRGNYIVVALDKAWHRIIYLDLAHRTIKAYSYSPGIYRVVIGRDGRIYALIKPQNVRNPREIMVLKYIPERDSLIQVQTIRGIEFYGAADIAYNDNGTPGYINDDYLVVVSDFQPRLFKIGRDGRLIKEVILTGYRPLFSGFLRVECGKRYNGAWGYTNTSELHILVKDATESVYSRGQRSTYMHISGDVFESPNHIEIDTLQLDLCYDDIAVNDFNDVYVDNMVGGILHISNEKIIGPLHTDDGKTRFKSYTLAIIGDQLFSSYYAFSLGISRYAFVTTIDTFYRYGPDSVIPGLSPSAIVYKISDWSSVHYEVVDSATEHVILHTNRVESPGYHFRLFDGIDSSGTLPDGTYKIRIITYSLYGDRGIDPPDTAILFFHVVQSETHQVITKGYTGATFFHNKNYYTITRVIDTQTTTGVLLSDVIFLNGMSEINNYLNLEYSGAPQLQFPPVLSANDSVLLVSLPYDTIFVLKNPFEYYAITENYISGGRFPAPSPSGKSFYYYNHHEKCIIEKNIENGMVLRNIPVLKPVNYIAPHPYNTATFIYSTGDALHLYSEGRDSIVLQAGTDEYIEEARFFPNGNEIVLLIRDNGGRRVEYYNLLTHRRETLEQSSFLRGVNVTNDGRFITYSQGEYVMGYPFGKIRRKPLLLIKTPLVGDRSERRIIIKGSILDNISPDSTTVYAHLSGFRVEWGFGEKPNFYSTDGVIYPLGTGVIDDTIIAIIYPPFKSDTVSIKVVAYSTEGDSAIRKMWVIYSPVSLQWQSNYYPGDTVDSYFDFMNIQLGANDTTYIKRNNLKGYILQGSSVVCEIKDFSGPNYDVYDSVWYYFTTYELRTRTGQFLKEGKYYLVIRVSDSVSSIKKPFVVIHSELISNTPKATYPPPSDNLIIIGDTFYLAYLSKGDILLAKGTGRIEPEREKWYNYSVEHIYPVTNDKKQDFYPTVYFDSLENSLYIAWGDGVGNLHLYKENISTGTQKTYEMGFIGNIVFTDIEKVDNDIYVAYGARFNNYVNLGVLKLQNDSLTHVFKKKYIGKLFPIRFVNLGTNKMALAVKKEKFPILYLINSGDSINLFTEVADSFIHDTFDISDFDIYKNDSLIYLVVLLVRQRKNSKIVSFVKDTSFNTIHMQVVDSLPGIYSEVSVKDNWLDVVGIENEPVLFSYPLSGMDWWNMWYITGDLQSVFRWDKVFGGVVYSPWDSWYQIDLLSWESKIRNTKVSEDKFSSKKIAYHFFPPSPQPACSDNLKFKFVLPEKGNVRLSIFAIDGRLISKYNKVLNKGLHILPLRNIIQMDNTLTSGVYLYVFTYGKHKENGKFMLIKK